MRERCYEIEQLELPGLKATYTFGTCPNFVDDLRVQIISSFRCTKLGCQVALRAT